MSKKKSKKRVHPKSATSPLVDREQAAEILNYSYCTIRRMEADGALTPVKLRGDRPSKTFYRKHQVYALRLDDIGAEQLDGLWQS